MAFGGAGVLSFCKKRIKVTIGQVKRQANLALEVELLEFGAACEAHRVWEEILGVD